MVYFANLFTCRGLVGQPTDAGFGIRGGLQLFTQGNSGFVGVALFNAPHIWSGRGRNFGGPGCPKLHTVIGTLGCGTP